MRARPNVIIISTIEFPVPTSTSTRSCGRGSASTPAHGTDVAQNVTNVHLIAQLNNFISAPRFSFFLLFPRKSLDVFLLADIKQIAAKWPSLPCRSLSAVRGVLFIMGIMQLR